VPLNGHGSDPSIDNDGNVYVLGGDYCWAFNPDGTVRWKYDIQFQSSNSSVAIGWNGTIYAMGTIRLYALDYSGQLKWICELPKAEGSSEKWSHNPVVIDLDETAYFGTLTNREFPDTVNFFAVNSNGSIRSQLTLKSPESPGRLPHLLYPDIDSTPAIGPGVLYVGSDRPYGVHLYRLK
jgi:hypothetical protein